ncbi:TetR/AcrR family transcriptional regulator (plasmid) [Paraburkholderia sp. D15]|uniref:TetR/AcrR family transcriptional regulator n=1 Tax=Paraburkholderia sp. D15 TaxID=2880218 RepID=UPI00247A6A5C|nr:TetR/AcrR family transcriptional regulator [Paraburkholderia sp. D15]WGS55179.1 TetR/AcrR family transcriptional regulator [Paraburkholderia sp. D15]
MGDLEASENYQTRVGALRREKTRNRLIESALIVFAQKGPDAPIIDDFIAAAGVARGTFYNYFRTTGELLSAVAGESSDEVLGVIDPLVRQIDDPAQRVVVGSRLYMQMATRYPLWGAFITRVGTKRGSRGRLLDEYLTRDLQLAIDGERFSDVDVLVARDIALGAIRYGIETLLSTSAPLDYMEQSMYAMLRAFGVDPVEAKTLAYAPIAECPSPHGPIFDRVGLPSAPADEV